MVTEARRAYNREYYLANRARLLAESKARYEANPHAKVQRAAAWRKTLWQFIRQQKEGKICARCGFSDPRALDFHHREGADKEVRIAKILGKGWGTARILEEMAKCDVLCANCHRILHAEVRDAL